GLVDTGEFLAAFLRELEGDAGDAGDFVARVAHGVEGFALLLVPCAGSTEVEAAEEFADEENVGAVDDLGLQRAISGQFFEGEAGAEIREAAEGGANLKESGFGALIGRQGIEFVPAHRAEEDCVAGKGGVESFLGKRGAVAVYSNTADITLVDAERISALPQYIFENSNCLIGNFRSNSIARCD